MDFLRLRSFLPAIHIGSGWRSQSGSGWDCWASQRSSFIGFRLDRDCRNQRSRQSSQNILILSKPNGRSSRDIGYRTSSGSERNKDSTFKYCWISFSIDVCPHVEPLSRSLPLAVLYRVERIKMSASVDRFDE